MSWSPSGHPRCGYPGTDYDEALKAPACKGEYPTVNEKNRTHLLRPCAATALLNKLNSINSQIRTFNSSPPLHVATTFRDSKGRTPVPAVVRRKPSLRRWLRTLSGQRRHRACCVVGRAGLGQRRPDSGQWPRHDAAEDLSILVDVVAGADPMVAVGDHRICASYHIDEDAEIFCRIVARPLT